jgi:hypothetical protein
MDRLLAESSLGGLAEKAENRTVRQVDPPSPLRTEAAAPNEQLPDDRVIQDMPDPRKSAAFATFFCEQTMTVARVAVGLGIAAFVLFGVVDLGREMQVAALNEHRGLIAVPTIVVLFAASYSSLVQRHWQTYLSAICIVMGLVVVSGALVSFHSEGIAFDVERWVTLSLLTVAIGTLLPLRFVIAAALSVYGLALICVFLIWTNRLGMESLWMQLAFALALAVFCAAAYFREQLLWTLFQSAGGTNRHDRA